MAKQNRFHCAFLAGTALAALLGANPAASAGTPAYTPLYPPGTAVTEQIQYRQSDGTLVTLMGMRPVGRHAREPWDNAQGVSGLYYLYPSFYFQNRTYGIEIHDHVPAGGNTIEFFLRVNNGTFDGTTFSLFRNLDPSVTGYGWDLNYGFNNPTQNNLPICTAGQPLQDCEMVVDSNWRTSPHSPLKMGDPIELAPAEFLERYADTQTAVIDGGGSRYYSFEQLYVVGEGLKPWYGVVPRLDSSPLPAATLLGGDTTVSYNYSSEPFRAFEQMANNIGIENSQRFVEGRRLFHTSFLTGKHSEFPDDNPVFTAHIGQLGPRFNQASCVACHVGEGRNPATGVGTPLDVMDILTGAPSTNGSRVPDPFYGFAVQQDTDVKNATYYGATIASYTIGARTLADGTVVTLRQPNYRFYGPVPKLFSVRQAPQLIGLGLLEAVSEQTILALAASASENSDGVHGVPNFVTNPETGATQLGRFGWKADKESLRHQAADALMNDMGVTSPVFPSRTCERTANCATAPRVAGVDETELERFGQYLGLVGVPARRSLQSGYPAGVFVPAIHNVNPAQIANGAAVFQQLNCTACHVATLVTGGTHPLAELRNQTIHPYTDLLLHDMGPGLADTLPEGQAQPQMWRTQPLWGLGYLPYVQAGTVTGDPKTVRYLHDGRARSLFEAIEWHDGEAKNARQRFEALDAQTRADLVAFLNSL
jgi:CxxC motif-containing protein (DUF1111 family)